jgi:hypothetical protein
VRTPCAVDATAFHLVVRTRIAHRAAPFLLTVRASLPLPPHSPSSTAPARHGVRDRAGEVRERGVVAF